MLMAGQRNCKTQQQSVGPHPVCKRSQGEELRLKVSHSEEDEAFLLQIVQRRVVTKTGGPLIPTFPWRGPRVRGPDAHAHRSHQVVRRSRWLKRSCWAHAGLAPAWSQGTR